MTTRAIGAPLRVQPTRTANPMGSHGPAPPKVHFAAATHPANTAGATDGGRAICARIAGDPSKPGQMRHTVGQGDG
jgi:hypothetical protein